MGKLNKIVKSIVRLNEFVNRHRESLDGDIKITFNGNRICLYLEDRILFMDKEDLKYDTFPWDDITFKPSKSINIHLCGNWANKNDPSVKLKSLNGLDGAANLCTSLTLKHLPYIKSLEGYKGIFLTCLDIEGCPRFKSLKGIPESVSNIDIKDTKIKEIDFFPTLVSSVTFINTPLKNLNGIKCDLETLVLRNISKIDLSYMPKVTKSIYLDKCTFTNIEGLLSQPLSTTIHIDGYPVSHKDVEKLALSKRNSKVWRKFINEQRIKIYCYSTKK